MKTMTIYGPNGEELKAHFRDVVKNPKNGEYVYLICRCPSPVTTAWCAPYVRPGYYHGVCPYCQTEIGIIKPDRYARLSGGGQ